MTPYSANPFAYIFSVVLIVGVAAYFAYGAIDRLGLELQTTTGTVTAKQFTPSGRSYYTTVAGGREWVQSQQTPETYAVVVAWGVTLRRAWCHAGCADTFSDSVQLKVRRTRITRKLEAVEITK